MYKLGVIDSGIGGLTIVKDIALNGLECEIYYISDAKNVPWGNKSQNFMLERISLMTEVLIEKNVQAILIACNTATAETINKLRERFSLPFVGVEPYINYIHHDKNSEDHKFALILTEATYRSERFQNLVKKLDVQNKIDIFPQKNLAMLIESLKTKNFKDIEDDVREELKPIDTRKYTHLILGCTHYPLIKEYFEQKMNLKVIDSTSRITERVVEHLHVSKSKNPIKNIFYSENAQRIFEEKKLSSFSFLNFNEDY